MRVHTRWLLALVCAVLLQGGCATTDAGDLAALEAFRAGITNSAFHGHTDNLLSDWTGDDPCQDWSDISCNAERVTSISLAAKGLKGTIARELGNAFELTSLQLGDNALSGTLPARLCNLYKLEVLRVENNALDGPLPNCMGVLVALTDVRLSGNALEGAIPGGFAHMALLTKLHLQDNLLTGELPDFTAMTSLTELRADNNFLEGSIPASITSATLLTTLHLSGNNLEGAIPSLAPLGSLGSLLLHDNALETALDPSYFGTHTFSTLSLEVTGANTIYCDTSGLLPSCDPAGCGVANACVCKPGTTGALGACDGCVGGYYGGLCDPCPGVADGNECYGFGTCDAGVSGTGLCPAQISGFEDAIWDDVAGENTLMLVGPAAGTVDAAHAVMITGDASCDGAPVGASGHLGAAPWVTFKGTLDLAASPPPYRVCYSTEDGADGTWMDQGVSFTPIFGMSDPVVRPFDYEHTWEMRVYDNDATDFDTLRRSLPAVLESGVLSVVWGTSFPDGASGTNNFGVRLGGRLEFPTAEIYTLTLHADNAARVIVDGTVETERWTPGNAAADLSTFAVDASSRPIVDVVIEYSHTSGDAAQVSLSWETVTVAKRAVPVSSLYASYGCVLDMDGGSTDWFEAAEPALPDEPAFTVAFWVRPNTPPLGEGVVLSVASDDYQQLLDVSLHVDSGEMGVALTVCDATWDTKVPVELDEWSHVAIAADLDSGEAILLINGVTRAEALVSGFLGASLTGGTTRRLAIGQRWDAALPATGVVAGAGLDGSVGYITLMNGADPEEARLHMTMEPLGEEHVVWHYRFDDCYATSPFAVVADRVGSSDLSRVGSGDLQLSLPESPLGHLQRGVRLLGSNTHALQRRNMRGIRFRAGAAFMVRVRIDAEHVEDGTAALFELVDMSATGPNNILALRYRHIDDTLIVQTSGSHEFSAVGIVQGQWHTILCSHDGASSITCYLDGSVLDTVLMSSPSNGGLTSRAWLTIGGTMLVGRSIRERLLGAVDDLKIWNRGLDASAAAAEMCNSHADRRDSSVVAHYDFTGVWVEDTAGEDWTLHDLSGHGNHLQLIGTLDANRVIPIPRTTIADVCGYAYDLGCALEMRGDKLRRAVHLGDLAEGGAITSLTVSYWLRLDELSAQTVFGYTSTSSTFAQYIGVEVDVNGDHYLSVSGSSVKCQATSLEAGRWYHILLSYDSADHLCHLYVDGVLDQNTADLGAANVVAAEPANDIATLSLGWEQGFVHEDEPLIGALDMFRLWINQGRVDSDIADAACITNDLLPAESLRYDFDECKISPRLADATGNGEDALVFAEGRADFSVAPPNPLCLDMSASGGVLQHYSPFEGVYSLFEPTGNWPHAGDITVALWVFPVQRGLAVKTLYQHSDETSNYLWITVNSNGQIEVTTYNGEWSGGVGSPGAVPVGEWTHVTVVLQDLATDTLDVYINGVSEHSGTLANSAPFMPPAGNDYVTVGHRFAGGNTAYDVFVNNHLQGFTDRVMVWSRALSAGEVAAVPCSAALPELNLVARWEFNDVALPEADGLVDSSGNSYTLHMLLHDDTGDELLPPLPAWAPPAARFDTVDTHNVVLGVCQDVGLCAEGTGCCGGDVQCGGAGICVEGACVCNDCTYGSHCIGVDTECVGHLLQRVTPDVVVEDDVQQYAELDFGNAPLLTQGAEVMWEEVAAGPLEGEEEASDQCRVAQTELSSEPFTLWSNFLDDALLFDAEQDGGPLEVLARSSLRVGVWEQSAALNEFSAGDDVATSAVSPVVLDRDGDGSLQFVWCVAGSSISEFGTLGGAATDLITDASVSCSMGMAAVDVNGDAWVDLIEGRGTALVWHRNNGGGSSFSQSAGTIYDGLSFAVQHWQVTDINCDGAVDVTLLADDGIYWCSSATSSATGTWTCTRIVVDVFDPDDRLSVSDVNGDGMLDIVATKTDASVTLYVQTSVFCGFGMDTPTFEWQQVATGALRACFAPSSLRDALPMVPDDEHLTPILCEMDGDLVEFEPPNAGLLSGPWPSQVVLSGVGRVDKFFAADVNADGRTDLAAVRSKSASVAVWPQMAFAVNGGHSTPVSSSTASTRLLNKLYVDEEFDSSREIRVCLSVDGGEEFHAQTDVSLWVGRGDVAVREVDPSRVHEGTTPTMTSASIGLLGSAQHPPRQLALSTDSTCTLAGVSPVLDVNPGSLGSLSETSPLFAVADFNNDGVDDVVHARTGDPSVRAWLLQSNGDHFAFSDLNIQGYIVFGWSSLTTLDEGDGVVRMFVSYDSGTRLWTFERGGMGISSDEAVSATSYTNVVTGRLDAEGSMGVYVVNSGDIDLWSSTATVETTGVVSFTTISPQMATGDFDGDGVDELVFGDGTDLILAQSDDPLSQAFTPAAINSDVSTSIESLAVGDVTGDGAPDVVYVDSAAVRLIVNSATTGLAFDVSPVVVDSSATGASAHSLRLVDLDADGDLDVLLMLSDDLYWYENTAGDGSSWTETALSIGGASRSGAVHVLHSLGRPGAVFAVASALNVRVTDTSANSVTNAPMGAQISALPQALGASAPATATFQDYAVCVSRDGGASVQTQSLVSFRVFDAAQVVTAITPTVVESGATGVRFELTGAPISDDAEFGFVFSTEDCTDRGDVYVAEDDYRMRSPGLRLYSPGQMDTVDSRHFFVGDEGLFGWNLETNAKVVVDQHAEHIDAMNIKTFSAFKRLAYVSTDAALLGFYHHSGGFIHTPMPALSRWLRAPRFLIAQDSGEGPEKDLIVVDGDDRVLTFFDVDLDSTWGDAPATLSFEGERVSVVRTTDLSLTVAGTDMVVGLFSDAPGNMRVFDGTNLFSGVHGTDPYSVFSFPYPTELRFTKVDTDDNIKDIVVSSRYTQRVSWFKRETGTEFVEHVVVQNVLAPFLARIAGRNVIISTPEPPYVVLANDAIQAYDENAASFGRTPVFTDALPAKAPLDVIQQSASTDMAVMYDDGVWVLEQTFPTIGRSGGVYNDGEGVVVDEMPIVGNTVVLDLCFKAGAGVSAVAQPVALTVNALNGGSAPVFGDPHFGGFHGGWFDFHGTPGRVYNLVSDTNVQLNARFVHIDGGDMPGYYMSELGLKLGPRTRILYRRDGQVTITPFTRDTAHPARVLVDGGGSIEWAGADLHVLYDVYRIDLRRFAGLVEGERNRTELHHVAYRLWFDRARMEREGTWEGWAPHGVHGQTGRVEAVVVGRGVQGEGVIEGTPEDYRVAGDDLFGDGFTFNQFAPTQRVTVPASPISAFAHAQSGYGV